ncbi:MAG: AAA family ATPase, partial [Chloroflexota bacterium]|nr:AAA family ATPase [Chloroflexota bacterium]
TQTGLAARATYPDAPGFDQGTVGVRTVSAIERKLPPGAPKPRPHRPSTIKALAEALDLTPGTPAWDEFFDAARDARDSSPDDAAPPFPDAEIPLFVPDGREAHLERLDAAIDMATREHPGVLFIGAEPGAGKSSLLAHLCRQAVDRHERLVVLWGDCTGRSGATDPWQPFQQAMGTLVGDTAAAGPQQLLSRKNAGRIAFRAPLGIRALVDDAPGLIDRVIPAESLRTLARAGRLDAETVRRLDRALNAAVGTPPAPPDLNDLVFRIVRRYAASGPVVLVLEDLHWADTGTANMLSHLVGRLRHQHLPVLVIASYRPQDLESSRTDGHAAMRQLLAEVPLIFDNPILDLSDAVGGAAGRAFVNAVVDRLLPDAPHPFRDTLFEQTAGLPLFVVTMLRWYLAAGDFTQELDPARLPSEIEVLFAGMIDRLPPELPPLLDAASVQGASFSAEVVMRVTGLSRPVLIDRLDTQLTQRFKMLYPGGVTSIADQRSHDYQFSHAMLRDYLYHRLSKLRREHLHAATADAMLSLYGDGEHGGAGRIAYHFDEAGERQKAASFYIRAGLYAMARQDFTGAQIHFQRIGELDLRDDDPFVVAQAIVGLGNCAYGQG